MKRVIAGAAVLVVIAVALSVIWIRERHVSEVAAPVADVASPVASVVEPSNPASSPLTAIEPAPAHERTPERIAAATSDPVVRTTARVRVLVQSREDGAPVAGVRVLAAAVDASGVARFVDSERAKPGEAPPTGPDGRTELELASGVAHEVGALLEGELRAQRTVEALEAGAELELVLEVERADGVRLFGQLVDADTSAPIAGLVRVADNRMGRIYRSSSHGGPSTSEPLAKSFESSPAIETDARGRFELEATMSRRPFADASAPGYTRAIFAVAPGHADPARPLQVRLSRTAEIEVAVHDRSHAPITDAEIVFSTEAYQLEQSETMLDFFSDGSDRTWRARTGPDGRATITDLPSRVPLTLSVCASGLSPRVEADRIALQPGERREIALVLGGGAMIMGTLADQHSTAVAGCALWREAANRDSPTLFRKNTRPSAQTKTDSLGRFQFDDVPAGKWWIGPAPAPPNGEADDLAPFAQCIKVGGEDVTLELSLRAHRGLYISGVVVDPRAEPVASCFVFAFLVGTHVFEHGQTGADGKFSLGPLPEGAWKLSAELRRGSHAQSESVEVTAGRSDLVLTVREGGSIAGEVIDPANGARVESEVSLCRTNPDTDRWSIATSRDGAFDFGAVMPGTYAVSARTRDGRAGSRGGIVVAPGARVEGVRVELSAGARLELAYEGTASYAHCRIYANGEPVTATSFERGTIESAIVPAGAIEVKWREHDAYDVEFVQRTTLAAGAVERLMLVKHR